MTGASERCIHLSKPGSGEFRQEVMEPGQRHVLDFYPDQANFETSGADLRLNFDDGAVLVLAGFFPALTQADFILELPDGTDLSGRDVGEALTLAIQDFQTNAESPGGEGAPPSTEDGGLPFLPADGPAGLLCHDSCGLFDESYTLPGGPDPHFQQHLSPFSRPAAAPHSPVTDDRSLRDCAFEPFSAGGDVLRLEDVLDPLGEDLLPGASQAPSFVLLSGGPVFEADGASAPRHAASPGPGGPENDWLLAFLGLGGL